MLIVKATSHRDCVSNCKYTLSTKLLTSISLFVIQKSFPKTMDFSVLVKYNNNKMKTTDY